MYGVPQDAVRRSVAVAVPIAVAAVVAAVVAAIAAAQDAGEVAAAAVAAGIGYEVGERNTSQRAAAVAGVAAVAGIAGVAGITGHGISSLNRNVVEATASTTSYAPAGFPVTANCRKEWYPPD